MSSTNSNLYSSLDSPVDELFDRYSTCPGGDDGECPTTIAGWWNLDLAYKPSPHERLFEYDVLLCLTSGMGAAYTVSGGMVQDAPVGLCPHVELRHRKGTPAGIAILDSLISREAYEGARLYTGEGSAAELAKWRAEIVAQATMDVTDCFESPKVALVGAVGAIAHELGLRTQNVRITDNDPWIIGSTMSGFEVQGGDDTLDVVSWADIALVTGMTLANGTFDSILEAARKSRTALVLYAETGASIANHLAREGIIAAAVCEPFPFYVFGTRTQIYVRVGK